MKTKLFTILSTALLIFNCASAQEYTIEEIQLSGGVQSASPSCINNNGVVVGRCYIPSYGYYGFIYENGVMTQINFSGSTNYSPNFSINDSDNFTGTVFLSGTSIQGFLNYGFLPDLGQGNSYGMDVNNSNLVLGTSWDSQNTQFMVIYQNTSIIHTYEFDGSPEAINDSGIVTGTHWPVAYGVPFIYDYHTGQFTYLSLIGSGDMEAWDINNMNQVVGYYEPQNSWAGFIWNGTNYIELPDKSLAYAINDSGVVVGEFRPSTYPPQHAFVYDQVNGFRDLNDLIPAGSGWELLEATDINDNGQIVGGGFLNSVFKSFILTPNKLTISKPEAGELFIAGEKDTIKWIGAGEVDSIKITAILNWNTASPEEIVIQEGIAADTGMYIWNISDTLLSYKTKIKIEDKTDPLNFDESASFRLKGYVLTRLKPDSTYEKFGRTIHAWQFRNDSTNMWPQNWWSQFSYSTTVDPYTNDLYNDDFRGVAANRFPDWLAFVRAFGVNQCYLDVPILGRFYRDAAVDHWKAKLSNWRGSCFGFALSSILAFYDKNVFTTAYPEIPPYNSLYQFTSPLTGTQGDSIRYIINALFTHQYGKQHIQYRNSILNNTPNQTINKIKSQLIADNTDGGLLRIRNQNGSGAHAIVVYKLVQNPSTPNLYSLMVYDNSYPGQLNAVITVDTAANGGNGTWNSLLWPTWGGNLGLQIRQQISAFLNLPIIPKGPLDSDSPDGSSEIETYVSRNSDIIIFDSLGNSIGIIDSSLFNTIPNAFPLISEEPSLMPPSGYNLPAGNYNIHMSSFSDTTAFLYLYNAEGISSYRRDDALGNQNDFLTIDNGFSIANHDQSVKKIELKTTMPLVEDEKVFQFKNISISSGDSLFVKQVNRDHFTFKNFGSQKAYDLKVKFNSESFARLFTHENVFLNQNTTHILYPDWDLLNSEPVKILIDYGNDGTIDDTLYINNTVDVKDEGNLLTPHQFNLAQNYPNPFNPVTTIRYSLPVQTFVTIKVYDILGAEVATLVDEEKARGVYLVEFDGSGLTSGIYFYQIKAGNFVETKKMILLK